MGSVVDYGPGGESYHYGTGVGGAYPEGYGPEFGGGAGGETFDESYGGGRQGEPAYVETTTTESSMTDKIFGFFKSSEEETCAVQKYYSSLKLLF